MYITEFIDHVLINEIGHIQGPPGPEGHKYLSFGLISQGIELLGAVCDDLEFNTQVRGASSTRFNRAITQFFPAEYQRYNNNGSPFYLYKNLRCGMLHVGAPGAAIALGQANQAASLHLRETNPPNAVLILVAEDLYGHFVAACREVIDLITTRQIYARFDAVNRASQAKREVIDQTRRYLFIG